MALNIQAIAFDKDGVIFDTETLTYRALKSVCEEVGVTIADTEIARCIGLQDDLALSILREAVKDQCDFDALIYERWLEKKQALIESEGLPFIEGVESLIESLHAQGYPLALVTSDSLEGMLVDINRIRPDLLQYFAVTITLDDVTSTKPSPEPYERAAALLGVQPENMLVIEDSDYGVESAARAGANVLAYAPEEKVSQTVLDKSLASIKHHKEVVKWLK